MVNAKEVTDKL